MLSVVYLHNFVVIFPYIYCFFRIAYEWTLYIFPFCDQTQKKNTTKKTNSTLEPVKFRSKSFHSNYWSRNWTEHRDISNIYVASWRYIPNMLWGGKRFVTKNVNAPCMLHCLQFDAQTKQHQQWQQTMQRNFLSEVLESKAIWFLLWAHNEYYGGKKRRE